MKTKINKWTKEFIIQEHTSCGWEDSTCEETYKEARTQLKIYRDNCQSATRLIIRRVLNPEWVKLNPVL